MAKISPIDNNHPKNRASPSRKVRSDKKAKAAGAAASETLTTIKKKR